MLGQLLHSFNPSRRGTPRQSSNLIESVTEDSHTRNLLFPDAHALYQSDSQQSFPLLFSASSPAGGASYDGTQAGIDLDQHHDFRIIIAQDEAGATPRTVLFDSKPGSGSAGSPSAAPEKKASRLFGAGGNTHGPASHSAGPAASSAFTPGHGRRSSLAAQGSVPQSPTVSAFQRARTRGASISNMQTFEESAQNMRSRESEEIVRTCLDCMFGSAPMAYRGPSNKLHIIPMESRTAERNVTSPPLHEGFGASYGRAEGRKQSRLATSYTASNIPPEPSDPSARLPETSSKEVRRRTILITRLFSVSPPDEVEMPDSSDSNSTTPTPGSSIGKGSNSYPFPQVNTGNTPQYPTKKSHRPSRTPMYAIGIILHLPVSPPTRSGTASQRTGNKSQGGQDSLGSSFDSERRAGWAFVDATFGVDSLLSISGNSDVDDRVDVIGQHWDVIVRTLTSLQFVVQDKVMNLFKDVEKTVPLSQPPSRTHGSRSSHRDPFMAPRRMLKLLPFALLFDQDVKQAVECAADRVVRGMKVPRVVTGQGRWGVWREEARWLGRWAGGREQNFFLFNLLTAFLGTHTEWLSILGPKSYRTKYREQQRNIAGEDITIASRTVIVSADKMAARRLIFLLANFFPTSNHGLLDGASPVRPSTSTSLRGYSQSPPNAGVSRQQSLRRTISRKGHKSYPNMSAMNAARGSGSDLSEDKTEEKEEKGAPSLSVPHSRRPSQVHSSKAINATALAIPSMVEDPTVRKGSTTTTSTVTPETAVPVAHFAVHRQNSGSTSSNELRPPSSGSLASVNLRHTLHRTGSGATSPSNDSSASKWGSFMSFWSGGNRRESSTDHSDIMQSTDDGVAIGGSGYRRTYNHSASKLEQMVHELHVDDFDQEDSEDYEPTANNEQNPMSPGGPHSAARAIPARSKQLDSPLKLSVNENDGVIDVDIALPGFGSPVQSPLLPVLGNSVGSLEGSTFGPSFCSSALSYESQPPVNVAGWLARYHQDFALQGVQPYADLEKDVRKSMSAEPTPVAAVSTPMLESGPMEKWVHVCTALIADARTFSIKRLHLKRKVRLIPMPSQPAITPGAGLMGQTPSTHSLPKSQYGNPYTNGSSYLPAVPMTELHLEEKFTEETVMDLDETLADALEKGISSSGVSTPAFGASASSIHPSFSTPTQRGQGPSQLQDKNLTPKRFQEQDEEVSPKKQLPVSVNTSATASATASASSSRSSSCRGRANTLRNNNSNNQHETSDAASTITALEAAPRSCQECKTLVLGALEQVVRSVAAERTGNFMPGRAAAPDKSDGSTTSSSKQGAAQRKQRGRRSNTTTAVESVHKESTLREGVRRWLAQVEDGN